MTTILFWILRRRRGFFRLAALCARLGQGYYFLLRWDGSYGHDDCWEGIRRANDGSEGSMGLCLELSR
jgi:hypothetical protein